MATSILSPRPSLWRFWTEEATDWKGYNAAVSVWRAQSRETIRQALEAGAIIRESIGGERDHRVCWSMSMQPAPFLEAYMTPEYLAEHLESRAQGFGWTLETVDAEEACHCNLCGGLKRSEIFGFSAYAYGEGRR